MITDSRERLGASEDEAGLYVRFEGDFGLNAYIGFRYQTQFPQDYPYKNGWIEKEFPMSIDGWENLVFLVHEWERRNEIESSYPSIGGETK